MGETVVHSDDLQNSRIETIFYVTLLIDNASCQEITGLDRNRAYRLLRQLATDGKLKSEGSTKSSKYTVVGPKAVTN